VYKTGKWNIHPFCVDCFPSFYSAPPKSTSCGIRANDGQFQAYVSNSQLAHSIRCGQCPKKSKEVTWNKEISRTNCRTVSDTTWGFVYVLETHVQEVLKKCSTLNTILPSFVKLKIVEIVKWNALPIKKLYFEQRHETAKYLLVDKDKSILCES